MNKYRQKALLEGTADGKMPTPRMGKWGWWFWPCTAVAAVAGTYWGMQHIETHLEKAAPQIVQTAGYDASGLKFKAKHRTVYVSGELPSDVSAEQLETILAKYSGPDGESIRNAVVDANQMSNALIPSPDAQAVDISVSANIDGNKIGLFGVVPSMSHKRTLLDAALLNYPRGNIVVQLISANLKSTIDDPDHYVNTLAGVISNLDGEVTHAQLNLDNEILSGEIHTTTVVSQLKLQAMMPDSGITVVSASTAPVQFDEPVALVDVEPVSNGSEILENQIASLEQEIRENVVFAASSDQLASSAAPVLDKIAAAMFASPGLTVEVGGHTDSMSSTAYNQNLSENRATAVVAYLVSTGLNADRLQAVGYGESQPMFTNDTAEGRAKNRRVEFRVLAEPSFNNSNH